MCALHSLRCRLLAGCHLLKCIGRWRADSQLFHLARQLCQPSCHVLHADGRAAVPQGRYSTTCPKLLSCDQVLVICCFTHSYDTGQLTGMYQSLSMVPYMLQNAVRVLQCWKGNTVLTVCWMAVHRVPCAMTARVVLACARPHWWEQCPILSGVLVADAVRQEGLWYTISQALRHSSMLCVVANVIIGD